LAKDCHSKLVTRTCPGCKLEKTYPERNKTCSFVCGRKVEAEQRRNQNVTPIDSHRQKVEEKELRAQLKSALDKQVFDARYQEFIGAASARPIVIPDWVLRAPGKDKHEVMPTAAFSDWHLDEVVAPDQIQGLNAYNRDIAQKRLRNYFENIPAICHKFLGGFRYPGVVIPWLGDIFSGNIHEELRATNADVLLSSLLHWVGPVAAGLKMQAEAFGHVYVPVVVGNHGRNTLKPIHKNRVRDNFDWLFAQIVARELAGDKRIEFAISGAADFRYSVYGTTYLATHGDQARGGSGIAAQLSPLMIMVARKAKRIQFDYLICGHWHRLSQFMKVRVNGSGVGYNEYAFHGNFEWEPPQQDLWLTDPKRGIVCDFPVHVASRDEPWGPRKDSAVSFAVAA
jgi:hypothetical protein